MISLALIGIPLSTMLALMMSVFTVMMGYGPTQPYSVRRPLAEVIA